MPELRPDRQTPQEIAAAAIEYVRARKRHGEPDLHYYLAHAEGVIAGLENLGAMTSQEGSVWRKRIWELTEATDAAPPDRAATTGRSRQEIGPPPPPRFVRLVPGPSHGQAFLDGTVRIVAVELFEDRVRLHWNIGPLPSFESVMGADLAVLNRDTEGMEPERRSLLRDSAFSHRLHLLTGFTLTDDLGTGYMHRQGHGTGGSRGEEEFGSADFAPATPPNSSVLIVRLGQAEFTLPLRPSTRTE